MQFLSIIWSDIQLVVTRKLNSLAFIVKRHVFLGELFPYNAMSLPLLFLNFADFAKKRVNLKKNHKSFWDYIWRWHQASLKTKAFRSNVIWKGDSS